MSSSPFIVSLGSKVPVLPPNWNMTNPEFARQVEQQLIWTLSNVKAVAALHDFKPVRIDSKGFVHGPFTVFVPYPKRADAWLVAKVFYLSLNGDGKLMSTAGSSHQVVVLTKPNAKGVVKDAYLVGSALLPQFTPNDRICPMQADKWQVWHKGQLTNLAGLLGFDKSAFSSPKQKNQDGDGPRGLGALQLKFAFLPKFANEEEVVRSLRANEVCVRRWLSSRQPVTREAREYLRANGERLTPSKKKQLDAELEESAENSASHHKSSKKKSKRDASPVRKSSKKTKSSKAPRQKKSDDNNLSERDALMQKLQQMLEACEGIKQQLTAQGH